MNNKYFDIMNEKEETNLNLILPSNACLDVFPENRGGNFKIQFEKSINLEKPMLCAVSDIILPDLVPYLHPSKINFILFNMYHLNRKKIWKRDENIVHTINFEGEFIYDIRRFIQKIVEKITDDLSISMLKKIGLKFNVPTRMIQKLEINYSFKNNELNFRPLIADFDNEHGMLGNFKPYFWRVYPLFDHNLSKLFNMKKYKIPETLEYTGETIIKRQIYRLNKLKWEENHENKFIHEEFKFKPSMNYTSEIPFDNLIDLYIMCDIINDSYINNVKFRYMKYCHCDSSGKLLTKFHPLLYFPVKTNEINTINLELVDRNFKEIIFKKGSVIIILKFKPFY